ncbi:patatin-like phospholipase family protein [Haloarchaeobius amylolyticus]|uniref:patatin-like phospholipase family protein n=1 Tax=Haloarchaeobius amylolyticus TaxID=1198296 RepID=UPI00226E9121|nr:patatin-like phospholipase family protein [Haloarchaeobius amylolyticus]
MTNVAVACQGGGSHTAFAAGALQRILEDCPDEYNLIALSGTSGGGICALLGWAGLAAGAPETAVSNLTAFWRDVAADSYAEAVANDWSLASSRFMSEFGSVGVSPYYNPWADVGQDQLRETVYRYCDVPGAFEDSEEADSDEAIPALFLGAVEVQSGDFTVFTTDADRVAAKPETFQHVGSPDEAADAALASAAVPTIFEAVEIDGRYYWDGLFSQNPPIRHFTAGVDVADKPDEIWIVRIDPKAMDPETRTVPPRSMLEITDRRTELSGNLSLDQEKHTIETVNAFVEGNPDYKEIQIREVTLRKNLDAYSKFDRDPDFLADLRRRGRSRASEFWDG